jgi:hypothetical protein
MFFRSTIAAALVLLPVSRVLGVEPPPLPAPLAPISLSLAQPASPTADPGATAPEPVAEVPEATLAVFGQQDTDWLTISGGVSDDFYKSTDLNLSLRWTRFIVDDVELGAEAGLWYFDQENDRTFGLNGTLFMRWHFVSRDSWTLFTDAGMGLLFSGDDAPDGGTSFNFTPRAGVGATFRIADNGTRLEVGIRWVHISNARIAGSGSNPGRDGPMIYAGVMLPF